MQKTCSGRYRRRTTDHQRFTVFCLKIPRKCLQCLKKEFSTEEKLTFGDYILKWLVYYREGKSSRPAHFLQPVWFYLRELRVIQGVFEFRCNHKGFRFLKGVK